MQIHLMQLVHDYGYAGIYGSLLLGIVGVPVPDEILMMFCGFLVSRGDLKFIPTLLAAFSGSISGMSLSYFVGRLLGTYIIEKRQSLRKKLEGAEAWFIKYDKFAIIIGYFVPGLRYLTAYFAGISKIRYKHFIAIAASGAAVWTTLFITLGFYLGKQWKKYFHMIERYSKILIIIASFLIIAFIVYKVIKCGKVACNDTEKQETKK